MNPEHGTATGTGTNRPRSNTNPPPTSLDGLWVLLTANDGELSDQDADGRVPVLARASNDKTYVLVFKNMAGARACIKAQSLEADACMIVRGKKDELIRIATAGRCAGALLDFDPSTGVFVAIIPLA